MTKYRLNKAEKVSVTINNVARTKVMNGKAIVTYSNYIRLVPDKVYETDDEAMLNFFRGYKRKVRYNGGRIKKISYRVVEVMDNE